MIKFKFNDQEIELEDSTNLDSFLKSRNFTSDKLIIELNNELLFDKTTLTNITLQNGDTLNVFSLVAGG